MQSLGQVFKGGDSKDKSIFQKFVFSIKGRLFPLSEAKLADIMCIKLKEYVRSGSLWFEDKTHYGHWMGNDVAPFGKPLYRTR